MVCKPPVAFPLALPKDACSLDSSFLWISNAVSTQAAAHQ